MGLAKSPFSFGALLILSVRCTCVVCKVAATSIDCRRRRGEAERGAVESQA